MTAIDKPTIRATLFRVCVQCGNSFGIEKSPRDANRQTCSTECRKLRSKQLQYDFKERSPEKQREYNANRIKKNPNAHKERKQRERMEIIELLGGKCVACHTRNPVWLHIDYTPTMRGTKHRHPRHKKWVIDNLSDFRLICANHHYELTITGKIEGTNITQ